MYKEKFLILEKQIELEDNAYKKIDLMILLAREVAPYDLEAMKSILDKLENSFEKIDYKRGHTFWLGLKALYAAKNDDYIKAVELADLAYDTFVEMNDIEGQIRALRILSLIYLLIGKFDESIDICLKGLALLDEHNLSLMEGDDIPINFTFLNNIAANYSNLDRFEEVIDYQVKAYEYIKSGRKGPVHVLALTNLGKAYLDIDDLEVALEFGLQGFELAKAMNLKGYYFHLSYLVLGQIYQKIGDYDKAAENFKLSLEEIDSSKFGQGEVLINLGILNLNAGKFELAKASFEEAILRAEEIENVVQQRVGHEWLAQCYEGLNEFSKAADHYKHSLKISREMAKAELNEQLDKYTADFKVEQAKKDAEIYKLKNVELKEKNEQIALKAKELEMSYHNISVLSEIGKEITSSLDIENILGIIYSSVVTLMDANIFGIGTYEEATGIIEYKMFIEESERLPSLTIDISESKSIAVKCVLSKESIVVNDISEDESSDLIFIGLKNDNGMNAKSLVYYPLILEGSVIGIITVQSYQSNAYTKVHLDAIKILASYIAIALNNSQQSDALQKLVKELEIFSKTDPLTELYNRRYMTEKISDECERYNKVGSLFSVIIADIDYFKTVNDTYGHDCGDFILQEVSKILKKSLREEDFLARWGGEEFLFLLTETEVCKGAMIAERLRKIVMNTLFKYKNQSIQITMTFGISEYQEEPTIEETIRKADRALYYGKEAGRNKCIIGGIHHCQLPHIEEIVVSK